MKIHLFGRLLTLSVAMIFAQGVCCAETCPTIAGLAHFKEAGWKILDSEDNQPLSVERTQQFQKAAYEFVLAEWVATNVSTGLKHGEIHCYYRDKAGSTFDAFLSKKEVIPLQASHRWYTVTGAFDCTAGVGLCRFPTYFPGDIKKVA